MAILIIFAVCLSAKRKIVLAAHSVVVVDKHGGKFKELHTVGIGYDESEIERLCLQGQKWIKSHLGIMEIDFDEADQKELERKNAEAVLDNIDGILLNGVKLILDKVFDSVGFNRVGDDVLRHLVIARLCEPMSKMATADYLKTHFEEDVNLSKIYRYMDKLYNAQQEVVQLYQRGAYVFCLGWKSGDAVLRCHITVL